MNATIDVGRYSGWMTSSLDMPVPRSELRADALSVADATTYAGWFACLADPTRVRLLHHVATKPAGITIGELADALGIGQPTVSHHVRKLAEVGFLTVHKDRTSTVVAVNPACCTGLPHAADAVMGVLAPQPCCPDNIPDDITVRPMTDQDWDAVTSIYADAVTTGDAGFDTDTPTRDYLDTTWLPEHRWVAEIDATVVGFAAATPVSDRDYYRGVADTVVHVAASARGRGVGKALMRALVIAADQAGLWTLQATVLPDNRAALALHHQAGYRTIGVRERIARHHGQWRDAVLLERRSPCN
ncbi:GNAT family N-acetyltransferase [Nocardia cyriacigeorgica]|nr:GNAT family N-acetyltransferase [Nocardia cyriacigeorgica]MBF6320358.1 GNAT family N-acetyltransferase [Nocardia cyriacigeorgica]MBF6534156.1 GNAT family N-acetyltransferase [Nocardia cyriacigeorgica]